MRTLGIVVAVAVVLLVGLPPVFGYIAAGQIEDGVAELEVLGLDAEILDYERGWFGSRARLAVDVQSSFPAGVAPQSLATEALGERPIVILDLAHGPVAVLDGVSVGTSRFVARLDPAAAGVGAAEERFGVPYLFEFRGRINFLGTLAYDADVPAVDTTFGLNDRLAFTGLDIDGTYSRGRLVAAAATESLAFVSAGGTLSLDVLAIELDQDMHERTGGGSFSVGRSALVDAFGTRTIFATTGLRVDSATAAGTRPELRNLSVGLEANSIDIADWDVTAAELALDVRNLDTAAIEQYIGLARAGAGPTDPAVLLSRLLAAGPELTLDPLRFRVDDEPFTATMLVAANANAAPPTRAPLDPLAATLWLNAVDGRATLEVAKPLATRIGAFIALQQRPTFDDAITEPQRRFLAEAQAGLLLAALMAQGILVESGDNYRVELGVRDGSVTVNGQPLL